MGENPAVSYISHQLQNDSLVSGELTAVIEKSDLSVSFYRDSKHLVTQSDYFLNRKKRGFDFELDDTEKIMGGGEEFD